MKSVQIKIIIEIDEVKKWQLIAYGIAKIERMPTKLAETTDTIIHECC